MFYISNFTSLTQPLEIIEVQCQNILCLHKEIESRAQIQKNENSQFEKIKSLYDLIQVLIRAIKQQSDDIASRKSPGVQVGVKRKQMTSVLDNVTDTQNQQIVKLSDLYLKLFEKPETKGQIFELQNHQTSQLEFLVIDLMAELKQLIVRKNNFV
ncbi:MAG: hypothetical protein WAM28_04445 [Chlamydiales bacterium]